MAKSKLLHGFGPTPDTYQMRYGDVAIAPHVVKAGGILTVTTSIHDCSRTDCYPLWDSWFLNSMFYKKTRRCEQGLDFACAVRVPKGTATSGHWITVTIPWTTWQGGAEGVDYYAVVGDDRRVIAGRVTDQAGHPLGGIHVRIAPGGYALTDANGRYSAFVARPGRYTVSVQPTRGGPFRPTACAPGVDKGRECVVRLRGQGAVGRADFEIVAAPKVKIVDPITDDPYPVWALGDPGTLHYPASPYADADGNIGYLQNVGVGDRIGVDGEGFDPHGGPITIFYDGAVVERIHAGRTFRLSVQVREPRSDCATFVTATQDGASGKAPVVLAVGSQVWAVSGTVTPRLFERPLKTGQPLCVQEDLAQALKAAVGPGEGVVIDRPIGLHLPVGGMPLAGQGLTIRSGRWSFTDAWDGSWLVVAHPAHAQLTAFAANVSGSSATVRLPARTLTLPGQVSADGLGLLSYEQWTTHFPGYDCHQLPVSEPSTRLHLSLPADGIGCFRDPFAGGIRYPHGLSAAGPLIDSSGAGELFIFGDRGIALGEFSFVGLVSLQAPAGAIDLGHITGSPRTFDDGSELFLAAAGSVTIG